MLGIMLRALLHVVCFTLLIPLKIVLLLWLMVDSIYCTVTELFAFREYWGCVWQGMKEGWEADMDIIRNGF